MADPLTPILHADLPVPEENKTLPVHEAKSPDRDAESLFRRYAVSRDPRIRERLVAMHHNLVRYLASKFVNRMGPAANDQIIPNCWAFNPCVFA